MQKKKQIKSIILITLAVILLLLLIFAEDIIKLQNRNKLNEIQNTAQAQYITTIGDKTYDITNAVSDTANPPTISAGMIPIKWDGNYWTITNKNDENWYNYSNGQPAYIMLNDGTYQSELIQDMTGKILAEENIGAQIQGTELGTIYMWIPRFAYNEQGEIIHIKQGYSVAGNWIMPEIFTYETEKMDFSLAGVWIEYNSLSNTSEVTTKINNMNKEESIYGFIANTKSNAITENDITAVQKYIVSEEYDKTIKDTTNINRTILKITNSNQLEPIKAKAYYDETEEKTKIEVTNNKNEIVKILNKNGTILSENSTTADTGEELIGNGIYKFIIIDNVGNMKKVAVKITGLKIYVIPDLETLKEFRDEVNAGNNFSGITVIQTADIQMNEGKYTIDEETKEITFTEEAEQWEPIGNTTYNFKGVYEGGMHEISGIYINNELNYQGLFGFSEYATIKNLTLSNSFIQAESSTGGFIGGLRGGIIKGCHNKSNVNVLSGHSGGIVGYAEASRNTLSIIECANSGNINGNGRNVGGIVGYLIEERRNLLEIKNVCNVGEITGIACVGGCIGQSSGEIYILVTNVYNMGKVTAEYNVGGITGKAIRTTVTNSYNTGNIYGDTEFVGGIVGCAYNTVTVRNSYNYGTIEAVQNYGGGIVGAVDYSTLEISDCYNIGEIRGMDYLGGIVGKNDNIVIGCYNKGNINSNLIKYGYIGGISGSWQGSLTDVYNTGNITAKKGIVGGIAGSAYWAGAQLYRTYNTGKVSGGDSGGIIGGSVNRLNVSTNYYLQETNEYGVGMDKGDYGTTPVSSDELKTLASTLGSNYWKEDTYNINNGYPILSWQTDNDKLNLINGDNAFVEDTEGINDGYPILAWQVE